jgi:hypothetical protein
MAECENLELKRRTAPEGSEKCKQKSGQQVPEGESKEKGQLPVYQSDRILREPQTWWPLVWLRCRRAAQALTALMLGKWEVEDK